MNKIVFLEAKGKRLSKLYSRHGVINYPMQKLFTSHEESVPHSHEGMQQKAALIAQHAKAGHCLLTGLLNTPLVNQSRAGKADKDALCYSLMIDIDNVVLPLGGAAAPYTRIAVKNVSEAAIRHLPALFHPCSYISQASNSFGMRLPCVSLHMEFFLQTPVSARYLKLLLTWLNFNSDYEPQIRLTSSSLALSYPLDITLAENTRLVYIAPPRCEPPIQEPFNSDEPCCLWPKTRPFSTCRPSMTASRPPPSTA